MTARTLNQWLKRLKQTKALTKTEIQSLCKSANALRFGSNEVTDEKINKQTLLNLTWYGNCEFKITKKQSKYGIEYLLNRYFKKDGSLRARANGVIGTREVEILKNFKKFTFVGLKEENSSYCNYYLIVYRVYDKAGNHFDYSPMHWNEILVHN